MVRSQVAGVGKGGSEDPRYMGSFQDAWLRGQAEIKRDIFLRW